MAPRTYLRKQVPASIPKSAMAINALFAANMVKKCHSKGKHVNDSSSLMECSMHLNKTDDTFSRLAKGENYNDVFFSADRAPYESPALSRSTVDIKLLMLGDLSSSRLKNSCNSINDGCISKSLMLIKSWEEQKPDFITQRRKTNRKAVHSFVKAKTLTKLKPSHSARMSASLNVTKPQNGSLENKKNITGARLSNRIIKRYFNGFSIEDSLKSLKQSSRGAVGVSLIEKAPERDIDRHIGFDRSNTQLTTSLQQRHNASVRITRSQGLLQASCCPQDSNSSIQNESHESMFLPSVNNSVCDNNIYPTKYTSTPLINKKKLPFLSRTRLGEINASSPTVTRQSRVRKQLETNQNDKTDNNYNSIITKREILTESPKVRRKSNRCRYPRIIPNISYESPRESRKSKRDKSLTKFSIYDDTSAIALRTRSRSHSRTGNNVSLSIIDISNIKKDYDVSTSIAKKRHKSKGESPVAMRTRSQSRSRNDTEFVSLDVSRKRSSVKVDQKFDASILDASSQQRKNSSVGRSGKRSAIDEEPNKENINLSTPFKRVTHKRKTVTKEKICQPKQKDPDNKSATQKAIPACSIKNIYRMAPMLTRLQRKKLLESNNPTTVQQSNNNNDSITNNSNLSPQIDLKRVKHNQILTHFNTSNNKAITINRSTGDYNVSRIKQETVALALNYSIEEVSSPKQKEIDVSSPMTMKKFLPLNYVTMNNYGGGSSSRTSAAGAAVVNSPRPVFGGDDDDDEDDVVVKDSPARAVVDVIDVDDDGLLAERLYINDVKQEHMFAVPLLPVLRKTYAPGKGYRRSILARRDVINVDEWPNVGNNSSLSEQRRSSVRLVPVSSHHNISGTEANRVRHGVSEDSRPHQKRSSVEQSRQVDRSGNLLDDSVDEEVAGKTSRDIVLRNCGQEKAEPWKTFYPNRVLKNCSKIGEGVYGEVFMFRNASRGVSVMKVIPIEGDQLVNGEKQKKFQDILSEIIIAKKLSSLSTSGFNRLEAVHLVHGAYPDRLLDLWRLYDETKGSENDCPDTFQTEAQLYLVMQLQNGGKDLESYEFKNPGEAYSIFEQLCHSLAQAEHYFAFEHRDLHWGNVLISVCDPDLALTYTVASTGVTYTVKTHGVQCNIIDFTLSRMTVAGGEGIITTEGRRSCRRRGSTWEEDWILYNDLRNDPELFEGEGDVQFDVYRQMRDETGDDWIQFCPRTNVYWLNYILQKMLTEIDYSEPETRIHKSYLNKMRRCRSRMQMFSNCTDVVMSLP